MAREIKFRGKRIDNGEWVVGDFVHAAKKTLILPENEGWGQYEVDPSTVGQFTGEYDAEGTEIYEGDLVLYPECVENDWESRGAGMKLATTTRKNKR